MSESLVAAETMARPYSKAVFEFAVEKKSIERWEAMLTLTTQVSDDDQIINLLSSPIISPEKLANIFITICNGQLDRYGENLIQIMAKNRRLSILPNVLKQFTHLRMMRQSTVEVEVISTKCLNTEQRMNISIAMANRLLLRRVTLNCKIDKSLLSGILIRTGDIVIDGSVLGRLERLSDILSS